ncbi:MAG: polysaccharide biosynthesis/export family protein [Nitrospirales bacterium]|nr:polysaccharide biosynthesis/export family protein [Nitrospirales bacterium]
MKALVILLLLGFLAPAAALAGDYVIGDGDTLFISVWGVKDLSLSVKVRPDGKITIPALGEVPASGMAPQELQKELTVRLKDLVRNPVVTVIVEGITNSKVYVFGGGVKPGVYELNRRTTLLQLLCQIGEVPLADLHRAYVLRSGKKVKEGLHRLFIEGDVSEDMVIESNDVLFVPELDSRNVYVAGAVNTPKFIEYRDGITIMDAILAAGWFSKFAKQNDVVLFTQKAGQKVTRTVKVKDLLQDGKLSENLKLQPGDYIVVKEGIF